MIVTLSYRAVHLGTIMLLTHASSFAEINLVLLAEVFLLNGILGLIAGECYMKDGLVAATGVNFWTDLVFHVILGLM